MRISIFFCTFALTLICINKNFTNMQKRFILLTAVMMVAVTMVNAKTEGALPGLFSVSPTSKVVFSQGNLQYQPSQTFYRFAEHQYDYVGGGKDGNVNYAFDECNNALIDQYYDCWIDLFGWGTSRYPYLASEEVRDYGLFEEWGKNTILNGGILNDGWRTLSHEEWFYLMISRPNAEILRGQATVNKVHGYILLPDNWQLPKKLSFTPNPNNWTTNVYSASQWAQMEKNGAVFLPAAGFRSGNVMNVVGIFGFYWSSTIYTKEGEDTKDARDIFFSEKRIGPKDHEKRFYGLSVRLVLDVQ